MAGGGALLRGRAPEPALFPKGAAGSPGALRAGVARVPAPRGSGGPALAALRLGPATARAPDRVHELRRGHHEERGGTLDAGPPRPCGAPRGMEAVRLGGPARASSEGGRSGGAAPTADHPRPARAVRRDALGP